MVWMDLIPFCSNAMTQSFSHQTSLQRPRLHSVHFCFVSQLMGPERVSALQITKLHRSGRHFTAFGMTLLIQDIFYSEMVCLIYVYYTNQNSDAFSLISFPLFIQYTSVQCLVIYSTSILQINLISSFHSTQSVFRYLSNNIT